MHKFITIFLIGLLFVSCEYFTTYEEENVVARVGDSYLYYSDIESLTIEGMSKEDSAFIVNNFVNRWATQQLLMEKAKINLTEEKLRSYEELIENYRTDLYNKGYTDIVAQQLLDSVITDQELQRFYEQNKDNFLLNEELIRLRFIQVGKEHTAIPEIKKQLTRFNESDQEELEGKAFQFKMYSLNDSIWVKAVNVIDKIPGLTPDNYSELLKKSNYIEFQDSLGVYLIQIKDVLLRNQIAPLSYVQPTIEQIILNRRKLEIIKNLEREILENAIKNKKFETFE